MVSEVYSVWDSSVSGYLLACFVGGGHYGTPLCEVRSLLNASPGGCLQLRRLGRRMESSGFRRRRFIPVALPVRS